MRTCPEDLFRTATLRAARGWSSRNLLEEARVEPPYVLVGTSGGGFITAGYALRHPRDVAGLVFMDTGSPFRNPPCPIVEETTWNHPSNVEQRDYLQVENDAWAARGQIGDIPVSVVTVEYSPADMDASPFASEQAMMRDNVEAQQGWLVLTHRPSRSWCRRVMRSRRTTRNS